MNTTPTNPSPASSLDNIIVFVDEEYGYRSFLWYTGMNEATLIAFWESVPSIDDDTSFLPGTLVEVAEDEDGDLLRVEYDEDGEGYLTDDLVDMPEWEAHVHKNDDSFLRAPGSETLLRHAGYTPD
jgi:hypothetical protein